MSRTPRQGRLSSLARPCAPQSLPGQPGFSIAAAPRIATMTLIFVLLAVGAGCLLPIQAGVNASLRVALNHPVLAAITNFSVGLSVLLGYAAVAQIGLPAVSQLTAVPWWCWLGGCMGAVLVLSGVTLAHHLGAVTFAACIIVGQLTASVIVDHFGWVGFPQHSITVPRAAGLFLLAVGLYLIRRS